MPNDLSSKPEATQTVTDAKADKATMERLILQIVQDYEERHGCLVSHVWLDDSAVAPGQRRTHAVRATVQL